jgi:hypothetical protein
VAEVTGTLPYDLNNLLGGAARVIVSDDAVANPAIPVNIADVIAMTSPYAEKTGWRDLGATGDSADYSRDLTTSGWEIQQVSGSVFEEVTEVVRTFKAEVAEINPENLRILENSGAATTIAAAAGKSAQKRLKIGNFTQLTLRRCAFVAMRNPGSGIVTEPGGVTRGRMVMYVAYQAALSADAAQLQIQKGELASVPVTFKFYPDGSQVSGEEYGSWFTEDAGTIT